MMTDAEMLHLVETKATSVAHAVALHSALIIALRDQGDRTEKHPAIVLSLERAEAMEPGLQRGRFYTEEEKTLRAAYLSEIDAEVATRFQRQQEVKKAADNGNRLALAYRDSWHQQALAAIKRIVVDREDVAEKIVDEEAPGAKEYVAFLKAVGPITTVRWVDGKRVDE